MEDATMNLVDIHLLQPVPPANLNRDDLGSPKDVIFGGVRRGRLSSQSQKRAVRRHFDGLSLLSPEERAVRTRLLVKELLGRLQDLPDADIVVPTALRVLGLELDEAGRTEYLLFLGHREIDRLAEKIRDYLSGLRDVAGAVARATAEKRERKKAVAKQIPDDLKRAFASVLDGGKAVDIALFGRMLADRPEWNVDAACQVAHAISTHRVDREFDFYTAVDDLQPREETGAGMMGEMEYYAATFYRYANVNLDQLIHNLQGDRDLALRAVEAFLRAFIYALPSGKQNAFAAHSLPQFIAILVRADSGPRNLAAAFEKPVYPRDGKSLTGLSVEALMEYWEKLDEAFGKPNREWVAIVNLSDGELSYHADKRKATVEEAVEEAIRGVRELLGGP
jgi:CRISPR system Cascade subunit CasC